MRQFAARLCNKAKGISILQVGFLVFVLILLSWILWFYLMPPIHDETSAPIRGSHGDWFGSLNTLFSGLAFGGVIITILLQSAELRSSTRQLEEQAKQLRLQANVMRNAAVLASLPTLLEQAIARLTALDNSLGRRVAMMELDELESDLQRRTQEERLTETLIANQVVRPDRSDETNAEMQRMQSEIRPQRRIINALEWYIGLRKDLFSRYAPLAGIDPKEPWNDRWGD